MMSLPNHTIFHAPDVSEADLAALRAMLATADREWTIVPEPLDLDVDRPLLDYDDVALIMRTWDRVTVAVLILAAVIALINLGRFIGIAS